MMISTDANHGAAVPGTRKRRSPGYLPLWGLLAALSWACTPLGGYGPGQPPRAKPPADSLGDYRAAVAENIALINARYHADYQHTPFIVDTDSGSAPVQTLINVAAAAAYARQVAAIGGGSASPAALLALVHARFRYVGEPQPWQDVAETIADARGDCKNLSLLLLALLTASGVSSHAGVSNGHMWVVAQTPDGDRIMEVDPSPRGRSVYAVDGFYERPLYRIYPTHAEKRRPRRPPEGAVRGDAPIGEPRLPPGEP